MSRVPAKFSITLPQTESRNSFGYVHKLVTPCMQLVGTGLGTGIELLYLAIFITLHTIYIIVITCVSCDLEILFYEV